jgi:methyl-accepting chemotaxis protein
MRLSGLRVGVRLAAGTGLLLLLMVVCVAVGIDRVNALGRASDELAGTQTETRLAMQVKFRAADFNGWQTAYAFDALRGIPGAQDSGDNRKAFLASTAAFGQELESLAGVVTTPAEQAVLDDIRSLLSRIRVMTAGASRGIAGAYQRP